MVVETAFRPASPGLRRAYGIAATAFLLVFVAWTRATWLGPLATRWFVDITSTLIPLGVGALAIARARHLPSERRSAWFLLGAAVLAWALGNMAWSYLELWAQRGIPVLERTVPFPSLADVGYLLLIPLAASALLIMVVGGTAVTTRMRTLLDGLLIASAMLFLGWALVLRPIVHYAIQQEGVLAQLVSLAYPLGDIVLLSLLILVATRVDRPVQASLAWLGLGLMCFTLADIGFWVQVAQGTYQTGSWSDPGWVAGFLIIGYAGLRPLPVVAQGVPPAPGLVLSALPLVPFLVATVSSFWVEIHEGSLSPFLFWDAIIVILLVTTRQFLILAENIRLRESVEAKVRELQAAQAARTQMLNNITHDLLSPLSPVRLQLGLLDRASEWGDRQRHSVAIIRRNIEQVIRMTGDLKDLAVLEAGRLRMEARDVDLAGIAAQVAETFQVRAQEGGVKLALQADGRFPVRADSVRISQVLTNLVSNAVKFTPRDGHVTVRLATEGQQVRVDVADEGRGLEPAEIARLFQPFTQVHDRAALDPADRGTGLGLFISKGIAQQHGGRIDCASPGRGKGSTFTLWLPRLDAASAAPTA